MGIQKQALLQLCKVIAMHVLSYGSEYNVLTKQKMRKMKKKTCFSSWRTQDAE
jgi:hypothetical protein